MKIIDIYIKNERILEITCKKPKFKNYKKEIEKITKYLKARDLRYKFLGWMLDENKNIVFTFRLFDKKDIEPYIKYKEGE